MFDGLLPEVEMGSFQINQLNYTNPQIQSSNPRMTELHTKVLFFKPLNNLWHENNCVL